MMIIKKAAVASNTHTHSSCFVSEGLLLGGSLSKSETNPTVGGEENLKLFRRWSPADVLLSD